MNDSPQKDSPEKDSPQDDIRRDDAPHDDIQLDDDAQHDDTVHDDTVHVDTQQNRTAPDGAAPHGSDTGPQQPPDIIVLTDGASGPEIAAATAVLQETLEHLAAEAAEPPSEQSPWLGSARRLREPIGPGHPGWRSFSG